MKRGIAFAGAAMLLLCGALVLWVRSDQAPTDDRDKIASIGKKSSDRREASPLTAGEAQRLSAGNKMVSVPTNAAKVASALPSLKPLPPANTPLRGIYRDLKDLSEQGDAHAACRLAVELARCANAAEFARKAKDAELDAERDPSMTDNAQWLRKLSNDTSQVCQGFTPDPGDQAWRFQLRAAQLGNVTSMLMFVSGINSGLDNKNPVATLEGWQAYQQYAPILIQRAVDSGSPGAYQLAAYLSRNPNFGVQVLPQDPVRAAAYYMALQSAGTPEYAQGMAQVVARLRLSPSELNEASMQAAQLSAKLQAPNGPIDLSANFMSGSKDSKPGEECAK